MKRFLKIVALLGVGFAVLLAVSPSARVQAQSVLGMYLTNGQLIIGSTGNAPVAATLTGSNEVSITNAAGAITVSWPTAASHVGSVAISSAATSVYPACFAGAFTGASPPASGVAANCLMVRTDPAPTGSQLYVSTAVTSGVTYWTHY